MKSLFTFLVTLSCLSLFLPSSAWAGAKQDWKKCEGNNHKRAIRACSKLIKNKRLNKTDRALAYKNRGLLNGRKGLYNKAINDYNKAITLIPKDASPYFHRGNIYFKIGQYDKAIEDYSKSIKINPHNSSYFNNRGFSYYNKRLYDKSIIDYNKSIKISPKNPSPYLNKANSYTKKRLYDEAEKNYNIAIRLNPKYAIAYNSRGSLYGIRGQYSKAIRDFNQAIKIKPEYAKSYDNKGVAYSMKGEYDKSVKNFTESLKIQPKSAKTYSYRGWAYIHAKQNDKALKDLNQAIKINPKYAGAFSNRGLLFTKTGLYDKAIKDFSIALKLDPKEADVYAHRGFYYATKNMLKKAIVDYDQALRIKPNHRFVLTHRAEAIAQQEKERTKKVMAIANSSKQKRHTEHRIALVISNSRYSNIPLLANPGRDGRAVAAAFRTLGFSKVTELYNANLQTMTHALKNFGDQAEKADWAVVYFAGHGIEIGGTNYLLPVDARLARAKHVLDEALPLSRVLNKVEDAKKVRLVILDACRNNPYIAKMARGRGLNRSVGRGLARIEPQGGVLVAYAARDGQFAEDGKGKHSPYTAALLHYLKKPGLEINMMFRQIRAAVQKKTKGRQTPYEYGALPPEALYFYPMPK